MRATDRSNTEISEKLIRDLIPEIIMLNGDHCRVRHPVDEKEKRLFLFKKVAEERREYIFAAAECKLEELADIGEVILAIGRVVGVSSSELTNLAPRRLLWSNYGLAQKLLAKRPALIEQGNANGLISTFDTLSECLPYINGAHFTGCLAAMFDIVTALAQIHGAHESTLAKCMDKKRRERGGFEKFLIMEIE